MGTAKSLSALSMGDAREISPPSFHPDALGGDFHITQFLWPPLNSSILVFHAYWRPIKGTSNEFYWKNNRMDSHWLRRHRDFIRDILHCDKVAMMCVKRLVGHSGLTETHSACFASKLSAR